MLSSIGNSGNLPVSDKQISQSTQTGVDISDQKDAKESATAPKFGDIYNQIQSKFGQKPEKPREIKKTLGKDDFLKIMITQMKNQDPTNPFKSEQMATQVAQFTSVEQLQNVNQNLNKMSNQNKPLEQMMMTNMIGKVVTVDKERFLHNEGENELLSFNLPRAAETTRVSILSSTGEEVFHKDLGTQNAGEVTFPWDGTRVNGSPTKTGDYTLRAESKDSRGQSIVMNPQAQSRVMGVSFEGLEPVLLIGDAQRQEKVTMRNIVRVEVDSIQNPQAARKAPPTKLAVQPSNFVPFQKAPVPLLAPNPQLNSMAEKGFPNGLSNGLQDSKGGGDKP